LKPILVHMILDRLHRVRLAWAAQHPHLSSWASTAFASGNRAGRVKNSIGQPLHEDLVRLCVAVVTAADRKVPHRLARRFCSKMSAGGTVSQMSLGRRL
jgi:hypothetical protein